MADENVNNWHVLLSTLARLEEGQRVLQVNQANTVERLQRLEQEASSNAEVEGTGVREAEPLTSEARGMLDVLYKNIPMFEYNVDQGASFANWYKDHEDLVEVQAACVPESNRIRFLLSRLGPQQETDLKLRCLPKRPIEMRLSEVIEKLKIVFVTKKSLFRKRIECLHVIKQAGMDYKTHIGVVNQACDEFSFNELTDTQFRVLNYLNSLRNQEDMEMRSWLIKALDRTPDMSLDDVGEAIDRYFEHKDDIDLPVTSVAVSKIGKATRERKRGERKSTQEKCKYCGFDSRHRSCPAQEKTCNNCGRRGHFAVVCQQKKSRRVHEVSSRSVGRRFVHIRMNGKKVRLQLDTGSDMTLISEATWKTLGRPSLTSPSLVATAANGEELELFGAFECNASYQDEQITGIVHVTARMNLLGLDWLERFPSFRSVMDAVCNRVSGKSSISTSKSSESAATYVGTLKTQFADVFSTELGLCRKTQASLQLRRGATAVFRPKRMVPIHYKENVEAELDRLEQLGVIERVAYSPWAAPILCVKKPNGSVRVCADFSTGLNDALEDFNHPIPTAEEIMTTLNGGTVFTTLDFKDAYLQVELEDDSKELLVINTHRGLYRYNRLCFGVKTAPGIFQQIMDAMLSGLEGCCAYLDDVIVSGRTLEEHNRNLNACMSRISEYGFHVNFEKCTFAASEIRYLGMIISAEGRKSDPAKIAPILQMPVPKDVSELRSFIGKINYYGRFIKELHKLRAPFDELLKKDVKWGWSKECQRAFEEVKKIVASPMLLTHYDPKKELLLVTDASQYGLGAVLLHRMSDGTQKAVEHATRTLLPAEKNYGQIEKEGLAIFWAMKKFYKYLMGRKFTLVTDHKPLVSIFGSRKGIPQTSANRLQRWAVYIKGFDFKIVFKPTAEMGCADVLSRLIARQEGEEEDKVIARVETERFKEEHFRTIAALPVTANVLREATKEDKVLQVVMRAHRTGNWPKKGSKEVAQFANRQMSISESHGILLFGERIVIPGSLKGRILRQLHQGHQGIVRTKSLARTLVYWPFIDEEIENMVKRCANCCRAQKAPTKTNLESWSKANVPWERVHADFAGPLEGKYYLVVVDAYSKWPEIVALDRITSSATISHLKKIFAQFGMPETLVTDNGTQFTSGEFALFCAKNGIKHMFSPPFHPQSNGQAERFVDTFKRALLKLKGEGSTAENLQTFLLSYRMTPSTRTPEGKSPAEVFLNRKLRTSWDLLKPRPERKVVKDGHMEEQFNKKHGSKATVYKPGDLVYARDYRVPSKPLWMDATVVNKIGAVLYEVRIEGQKHLVRRHANQLRSRSANTRSRAYDILMDAFDIEPLPRANVQESKSEEPRIPPAVQSETVEEEVIGETEEGVQEDALEEDVFQDAASTPVPKPSTPTLRRSSRTRHAPAKLEIKPSTKRY